MILNRIDVERIVASRWIESQMRIVNASTAATIISRHDMCQGLLESGILRLSYHFLLAIVVWQHIKNVAITASKQVYL